MSKSEKIAWKELGYGLCKICNQIGKTERKIEKFGNI